MFINVNVEVVFNCLMNNNKVFTLRKYPFFPKICILKSNNVEYYEVKVIKISEINNDNYKDKLLLPLKYSGFNNLDDWWNLAVKIHKTNKLYLYKIELI